MRRSFCWLFLAPALVFASELVQREALNPGLGPLPAGVVRTSPAVTWRGFLTACALRQYGVAQHYLDLAELPRERQAEEGPERAEALCRVVLYLSATPGQVKVEDPQGPSEAGVPVNVVSVLRFSQKGINGEVVLRRTVDLRTGQVAWLFSSRTVASAPAWYRVLVLGEPPKPAALLNPGLPPRSGLQRATPREAFLGFWEAAGNGDFLLAAHYLDLDSWPEQTQRTLGPLWARRLFLVLLRGGWVNEGSISNLPMGSSEEGLPESRERLARVEVRGRTIEVLLADTYDENLGHVWRFAPETLEELPLLYRKFGYGWLGDHAPSFFFAISPGGLMLWQWLLLLLVAFLGYWLTRWVGRGLIRAGEQLLGPAGPTWARAGVGALQGPLGLWLWALVIFLGSSFLGATGAFRQVLYRLWQLLSLGAFTWFAFRLQEGAFARWREQAARKESLIFAFLPIFHRVSRVLLLLLAGLLALHLLGVPVTTVLAGLGIGGVAVAFAAQKTLENIFAAVAIAADRPFRVGDTVRLGNLVGVVEDVGLRSCRLRTPERTLVTVPNSQVVGGEVVNLTARDRILFNPTLGLTYTTKPEQLRRVLQGIRQLLADHPRVVQEGARCRFRGFGESALLVEVFCWLATNSWEEYLALAEELNFALAHIVAQEGSAFAYPTRTVYLLGEEGKA
jgi:MscS family membrane protein